jgi:hypothetical protein
MRGGSTSNALCWNWKAMEPENSEAASAAVKKSIIIHHKSTMKMEE